MREPIVTGVAGGAGTRTVAFALGAAAHQPGRHIRCDVLVARATVHALSLAEQHIAATGDRPVLAVLAGETSTPRAVRAKLRMIDPHASAIVRLPWVGQWSVVANPYAEAHGLAFRNTEQVPKHLRNYHQAVAGLLEQVRPLLSTRTPGHPATHGNPAPQGQPPSWLSEFTAPIGGSK